MTEIERIQDQLKRSYAGNAWHGPALAELLGEVDARRAGSRPVSGAHTIREIVRHLVTWTDVARRRVDGERVDSITDAEDWPQRDAEEEAWEDDLASLEVAQERLLEAIGGLEERRLDEMIPEAGYSLYFLLHGVIQHQLYHAGQIALLLKAEAPAAVEGIPAPAAGVLEATS